jgi:hypothetical protein
MTMSQLAATFHERYVIVRTGPHAGRPIVARSLRERKPGLDRICRTSLLRPDGTRAPFGDFRVRDVVTDTVEQFREARLAATTGKGVGANRDVRMVRELFNWAILKGSIPDTWVATQRPSPPVR